ncbi:helix-turn-helix transcriptional regulator [Deinococcus sp.]|uniref:helix-turn-helix transcriptional regulator n=1 Tax=Deinococcus sp. TaxID=47478 RepID=UPI003CC671FC
MNRTDRLLALVLELRGHPADADGWVRASELARHFGVSVRTIYRDVLALNEAGVPVLSVAGQGYRLMDGYFLPPLHLTAPEALMLAFGIDAVRPAFDAEYAQAAHTAARKLLAALPDERRRDVQELRSRILLVQDDTRDAETLKALRRALLDHCPVTFQYHAPGSQSERRADPLGLLRLNGLWMLTAWDHDRGAQRNFRLDRMETVRLLQMPARTPRPLPARRPEDEGRRVSVRLRFPTELRRWVRERPNYFQVAEIQTSTGYEVALTVRGVADILPWVLSWGAAVKVLEPDDLRERVKQEARSMLEVSLEPLLT